MYPQYIIQSQASNIVITWDRDKESGINRLKEILRQEGKCISAITAKKIRSQ